MSLIDLEPPTPRSLNRVRALGSSRSTETEPSYETAETLATEARFSLRAESCAGDFSASKLTNWYMLRLLSGPPVSVWLIWAD
jgi:hypothetical protein